MELDRDRMRAVGWVAVALVVAVLAVRALAGGDGEPAPVAVEPPPARGGPVGAAGGSPGGGGATLAVQVAGEVRRPGVYQVPAGARVHEAVERAGGLTRHADQAGVNLVAKVADGQQVIVPRRGAGGAGPAPSGAGAAGSGSSGSGSGGSGSGGSLAPKVSLASATPEQLDAIDGIGPTLARRIVEYRTQHGGFRSVEELRQVEGIGEKRFESLREAVTP
ncbi:MAG TPA: helix-hairpin-helix domain-containing protein [Thermoleophilaceae bacterium]|jgi:competence protein ComEA